MIGFRSTDAQNFRGCKLRTMHGKRGMPLKIINLSSEVRVMWNSTLMVYDHGIIFLAAIMMKSSP